MVNEIDKVSGVGGHSNTHVSEHVIKASEPSSWIT
jgi:hypothetical protein